MNKAVRIFVFILLLFPALFLQAQNFKSINKKANEYFFIEAYGRALPLFLWMDSVAPGSAELNYKIGFCYLKTSHKQYALPFLETALRDGFRSPGMDFNLGIAYHANQKFPEAITNFERALYHLQKENSEDLKRRNEINRYLTICKNGLNLISKPLNVTIENLGAAINSPCPEYAPVISGDESTLIFTSRRPCETLGKIKINDFEDIFISEKDSNGKWALAQSVGKEINTAGHDASAALSADGRKLFIYKDAGNGDIFESDRNGNSWSVPKKLPAPINSTFWEPSASLSADGNILFFVSNRPGGKGGRDIYICYKTGAESWSAPKNLGSTINTEYDEDAPFMHPDGKTLYFSSEGHTTMGGFDVFYATLNENDSTWSVPENIGYPINTVEDDLFFVWSADGKRGYYSSERKGGYGDKDIYKVIRPDAKAAVIVLKGAITSENTGLPLAARIVITNNKTEKLVGTYYSDSLSGKYAIFLSPGENYGIAVDAIDYLPYSDNVDIEEKTYSELIRDIKLKSLEKGKLLILKNVFFDSGKSELKKESHTELNNLSKFLKNNGGLKVEIAGYTDNIGDDNDNQQLSEKRALSVVKYLENKGIDRMRLIYKGYGEQRPIAENATEEGRKINRRTEFILID